MAEEISVISRVKVSENSSMKSKNFMIESLLADDRLKKSDGNCGGESGFEVRSDDRFSKSFEDRGENRDEVVQVDCTEEFGDLQVVGDEGVGPTAPTEAGSAPKALFSRRYSEGMCYLLSVLYYLSCIVLSIYCSVFKISSFLCIFTESHTLNCICD